MILLILMILMILDYSHANLRILAWVGGSSHQSTIPVRTARRRSLCRREVVNPSPTLSSIPQGPEMHDVRGSGRREGPAFIRRPPGPVPGFREVLFVPFGRGKPLSLYERPEQSARLGRLRWLPGRSAHAHGHQELAIALGLDEPRPQQFHRLDDVHVRDDLAKPRNEFEFLGIKK
jgi:hypothetical protein